MSDTWAAPEDDPRSYGNPVGEKATYREYLGNYRLTIEMKCEGLDAEQLARRSVPPSAMSLLGLVRHLAQVENQWFQRVLQGQTDGPRLYKRADDSDWDFTGALPDPAVVADAFATWKAEIARAQEWLDALKEDDLGREVPTGDGAVATRDVLVHVIEEYARHAGHADFLRECVDGRTGQLAVARPGSMRGWCSPGFLAQEVHAGTRSSGRDRRDLPARRHYRVGSRRRGAGRRDPAGHIARIVTGLPVTAYQEWRPRLPPRLRQRRCNGGWRR